MSIEFQVSQRTKVFRIHPPGGTAAAVADIEGRPSTRPPPPSDQIFFNFMQFSENFNKIVSQRPPPEIMGWRPLLGKSWICHCAGYPIVLIHPPDVSSWGCPLVPDPSTRYHFWRVPPMSRGLGLGYYLCPGGGATPLVNDW